MRHFPQRSALPPSDWRQLRRGAGREYVRAIILIVEIVEIRGQRRHALRQIGVDPPQQLVQVLALLPGKPRKGLGAHSVREVEDTIEDRACLVGQNEASGSPVPRLGPPFDPAVLLHAVDLPHQCHRFDFEQIGKARLVDAFIAGKVTQHLALRPGEPEEEQGTLVETTPEQAGDIVDEKPKAAVEIHGMADRNNYPKVIISNGIKTGPRAPQWNLRGW
jgi:hypothetical protein